MRTRGVQQGTLPDIRRATAVLLVLLVAGCATDAVPPVPAPVLSVEPVPVATPTPASPPTVTLAFGGDVHFENRTRSLLSMPGEVFGPVSEIFRTADLSMVNLETAVTEGGTPEPKQYLFRAPASAFHAVSAAGLDAVSLANNHALDYGHVGLADTLTAASVAGVPVVGAGRDATEAYAPWVTVVRKGVRVAVLAFSQVTELATTWVATDTRPGLAMAITPEQIARAAEAVRAARAAADVVVVFMHWGQESNECPIPAQRLAAQAFAEAGAAVVVGSHAHLLQGDGWLGGTYVAYGLGNFLWYADDSASNDTGVVRITLTGASVTAVEFVPAVIDRTTGQPIPASGEEAARVSAKFAALRACTGLADAPS